MWLGATLVFRLYVTHLARFGDTYGSLSAAVILMLVGTRHDDSALITGVHLIAALIILLREIAVSGLREFLAGLQVSLPVSKLGSCRM